MTARHGIPNGLWVRFAALLILPVLLLGLYWFFIRPSQLRWGATRAEVAMEFPEDRLVAHPAFDATRAITIQASQAQIWPWLAQMGYDRAGFYGYDLIENLGSSSGLRSASAIQPRLQSPQPGDVLPLSKAAELRFGRVDAPRTLVWEGRESPPRGVFIWALVPQDATHTRLISRIRWRYEDDAMGRALGVFTEFADHVAVKEILRGVRDRAENRPAQSLWGQGFEIAGWFCGFLQVCAGAAFVLFSRRWKMAWVFAFGAGLVLQFALYGPAPHWINATLPWVYLLAFVYVRKKTGVSPPVQVVVRVP